MAFGPLSDVVKRSPYWWAALGVAVALAVALVAMHPVWFPSVPLGLVLAVFCAALLVGFALARGAGALPGDLRQVAIAQAQLDDLPTFITDASGRPVAQNAAADKNSDPPGLDAALSSYFASPSTLIARLAAQAQSGEMVVEDGVTRRGYTRLRVQKVDRDTLVWRFSDPESLNAAPGAGGQPSLPMLTVGPSGAILFMNEAFRKVVGGRVKSLDRVFCELPIVSGGINRVEGVDGVVESLTVEIPGPGGRHEVYLLPGVTPTATTSEPGDWHSFETLPVPLLKVGVDGIVLASNKSARDLLTHDFATETRLSELMDGLGRPMRDWLEEAVTGRGSGGTQFLRGAGARRDLFLQVALCPVHDADQSHAVAVLHDVTELKALEAQFVQSQKMQAIGQLAGGIAHDFNNLLTAISGHCDLLLLRHDQDDADYGDLSQIHQNASRAASLVGQLLAFSRKQDLRLAPMDLRDTLADLTHLLNRLVGEKVTLKLHHDPQLSQVKADRRQLEQVIINLVVNARDSMADGGEVLIETENLHLRHPLTRDRARVPAGDYALIKVVDEGCGIPVEMMAHIFEPFYTTKNVGEGTGLGLSTVYGIIKQSGGFIFADSIPEQGTTFSILLPAHHAAASEDSAMTATAKGDAPKDPTETTGVVLLVEDEAPVRAFASRALRLRGYEVIEADSAESALEVLENRDTHVDLFITDVIMPGMDGPTWVRQALENRPATKVVFMSGYSEDGIRENRASIPNSVFLPKPFSLSDLTDVVQRQLH